MVLNFGVYERSERIYYFSAIFPYLLSVFSLLFLLSSSLFSQTPFGTEDWNNFSAYVESMSTHPQGKSSKVYKFYYKKGKSRMDFLNPSPVKVIITLREKDRYIDYIKLKRGGWRKSERFFERIGKDTYRIKPLDEPPMLIKREDLPEEIFQRKQCMVRRFTFSRGGKILFVSKMYLWKERMVPLKVEVKSGKYESTHIYKNIDFGEISDKLFEVPLKS